MEEPLLKAERIVKTFSGVVALNGANFELRAGEIHAVCGENGAGKSTLIKILSGVHPHGHYEGELRIGGRPLRLRHVSDAARHGIAVIYQELALVEDMTVAENIFLGAEPTRGLFVDHKGMARAAGQLLNQFEIRVDPGAPVRSLGVGQKQLVEIAKSLRKKSRILILDEPTAALTEQEVSKLLEILRNLRSHGLSSVYVSHKLDEVFAVADRITVLRDGASVATFDAKQADKGEIVRHMVGREIKDFFPRRRSAPGAELLRVEKLSVQPGLREISFRVCAGEVLGIGGLMGAGRTELLMHLFGAGGRRISGEVHAAGKHLAARSPGEAMGAGLGLVSEDRKRYGLVADQSVGFNLSLSALKNFCAAGRINRRRERGGNQKFMDALRVKAPNQDAEVGSLSGGNQQKVVLGKSLMTEPMVILLDEPTRGIDVGAKVEVYELINQLTANGKAVVLVSSELGELMGMSDRILMLHEGGVGGEFSRETATPEKLLSAAMGLH